MSADATDADDDPVAEDDNGGLEDNFLIDATVAAGSYILWVRGGSDTASGSYRLRTSRGADGPPTGAPSNVTVRRNAQQLTVRWTAVPSLDNTGSPITAYQAVATDSQGAGKSCTVAASSRGSCAIAGLQYDKEYSVYVRALNAFGQGPNSASVRAARLSDPVLPTVPPAPEDVGISIDHSTAIMTVSWDPILEDATVGEVTGYRAEAVSDEDSVSCEASGLELSCELSGFSNGVTYELTVTAENAVGAGAPSRALSVTPKYADDFDHSGVVGSAATSVGLYSATAGNIASSGDGDVFRIDVTRHGTLYLWTQGDVGTYATLRTEAPDSDIDLSQSGSSGGGQGNNFLYWPAVSPGIYYVSVNGSRSSTGDYTLFADLVVDDHGDNIARATRVGVESETAGYLTDGDVDWFRVDVTRRGTLYLWTQGDVNTYATLRRRASDADIGFGGGDSQYGEGSNFWYWAVTSPGIYYVAVRGYRSTGDYTLFVDLVVDDHGDTTGSATRVAVDSETGGHLANGDVDWFRIDVTQDGTLRFLTEGDADTWARLRTDREDLNLGGSDNGGQGYNFSLWYAASPDTYYLEVGGYVSGREEYKLFVSFEPTSE